MIAKADEKPALTALLSHVEAEGLSDSKDAYIVKFI